MADMSDVFTQFSVMVPWQGPRCTALLEKLKIPYDADTPAPPCEFEEQPDGVWLYSEDNCYLEALVAILADVQSTFHLPPFGFEFSVSCSKPVLSEFGGGAVCLKDGEVTWLSTGTWLAEQLAAPSAPPAPA